MGFGLRTSKTPLDHCPDAKHLRAGRERSYFLRVPCDPAFVAPFRLPLFFANSLRLTEVVLVSKTQDFLNSETPRSYVSHRSALSADPSRPKAVRYLNLGSRGFTRDGKFLSRGNRDPLAGNAADRRTDGRSIDRLELKGSPSGLVPSLNKRRAGCAPR